MTNIVLQMLSCKIFYQRMMFVFFIMGIGPFFPAVAGDSPKAENASDNRLVICLSSDVESLDPTNHRSRITQIVLKSMFDSLTTRDSNNHVVPQLAESWELIGDTLWKFKIRKGVRFHDGSILYAGDVKYTLDRVTREGAVDGQTSPRKSLFEPISEVTVEDDDTVFIKTSHPWPNLPMMLSLQEIVPKNYLETVGSKEFTAHPVGTGPFQFIGAEPGKNIILERFDDYYGGSPLKPPVQTASLKKIIFKVVPLHLDQLSMLKTGKCDLIYNVPPESIDILKMASGIRVLKAPATRSHFAEINCVKPPFNDTRVRQAMNYGVDIDSMVKNQFKGQATGLSTILLPDSFGYNPDLKPYPYDPFLSRQLLQAAAFPHERFIDVYTSRDELILADSIVLYLTKLGLRPRMVISSESRPGTKGADAPWDIFVGSWGNTTLDPAGILLPKLKSNGYGNFSGFASTELDTLMLKAQRSMNEMIMRQYYHQIQTVIFDQAPMIFGYASNEFYAIRDRVHNFWPSVSGMIDLHDVSVITKE